MEKRAYLFTGVPGSGKSTLAKRYSKERGIQLISKDEEQLALFRSIGFSSPLEKKSLVQRAEEETIRKIRESKGDVVIDKFLRDANFLNVLSSWKKVTVIYLYASTTVLVERYNARRTSVERLPFETKDLYPFVEGKSHLFPPMDEPRMRELLEVEKNVILHCENVIQLDNSSLSVEEELALLESYGI